ncbi:MAG TPA: class I SAM-dependent methyltransferase [Candidatus Nitrosotalea sp.]|nr:class I SAM-dependent methyltransferase [Candidatus Nitrosotalea sp.]
MGHRPSATSLESELVPDELDALVSSIRRAPSNGRCLETGTTAGGTLCRMMSSFEPGRLPQFVVVDPMTYFLDQLEIVKRNLRQHQLDLKQVDFRVAKSADAFLKAEATNERYDFMLIDGAHKIRHVTKDLLWTRLLKVGGLVCFHDYNPRHKGVLWSVDRFLARHPNYAREGLRRSLLSVRNESASPKTETDQVDRMWSILMSPRLQLERNLTKRLRRRSTT